MGITLKFTETNLFALRTSDQKQNFSEPSNQITWNFVILEAVVLIILFFKQLFKAEFKARPLLLDPRTSSQSKEV